MMRFLKKFRCLDNFYVQSIFCINVYLRLIRPPKASLLTLFPLLNFWCFLSLNAWSPSFFLAIFRKLDGEMLKGFLLFEEPTSSAFLAFSISSWALTSSTMSSLQTSSLPCRWSPPPQILHSSLAPKLLHKPVQGSSWGRWRGVGYTTCGRRPPDDENETRERERTWRLPVSIFSPDLCQVSPLHLLFHQKCALGHGPFPYHGEALKLKVRSLTILINDP